MEELFQIIGRLYTDMYNMQKYMEVLQNKLKEQEQELLALKNKGAQND
jgi:hypothetical protein